MHLSTNVDEMHIFIIIFTAVATQLKEYLAASSLLYPRFVLTPSFSLA